MTAGRGSTESEGGNRIAGEGVHSACRLGGNGSRGGKDGKQMRLKLRIREELVS